MAERKGFEPSIRYSRIHAFQACDFNHSSTSLWEFGIIRPLGHNDNHILHTVKAAAPCPICNSRMD